jgi:hypothetical protein
MGKARGVSGGGIESSKVVSVGVKGGPARTNVMSPGGASQLGGSVGKASAAEPLKVGTAAASPLGNSVATNVGKGGPGAGRTVHPSGGQGKH